LFIRCVGFREKKGYLKTTDDFSDLEKEQQEKFLRWIERGKIIERAEREKPQAIREQSVFFAPEVKKARELKELLFARYCGRHGLTDQQIKALERAQDEKEFADAKEGLWSKSFYSFSNPPPNELTGVSRSEAECDLWDTALTWRCMGLGCHNKTNLMVTIFHVHPEPLCLEHWKELKALINDKNHF
jgi:hypothetical protein